MFDQQTPSNLPAEDMLEKTVKAQASQPPRLPPYPENRYSSSELRENWFTKRIKKYPALAFTTGVLLFVQLVVVCIAYLTEKNLFAERLVSNIWLLVISIFFVFVVYFFQWLLVVYVASKFSREELKQNFFRHPVVTIALLFDYIMQLPHRLAEYGNDGDWWGTMLCYLFFSFLWWLLICWISSKIFKKQKFQWRWYKKVIEKIFAATLVKIGVPDSKVEMLNFDNNNDVNSLLGYIEKNPDWIGSVNQQMHHMMRDCAKELATWAVEQYQPLRTQYPELSDGEICKKMLDLNIKFPSGEKDRDIVIDRYGSSLNGLCYYLGLRSPAMKDMMISRCIQFTEYIDIELESRGFKKPSDDIRRGYFKTLGLPENAAAETRL